MSSKTTNLLQQARSALAREREAHAQRRRESAARAAQSRAANADGQVRVSDGWHTASNGQEVRGIHGMAYMDKLMPLPVEPGSDALRRWEVRPVCVGKAEDVLRPQAAKAPPSEATTTLQELCNNVGTPLETGNAPDGPQAIYATSEKTDSEGQRGRPRRGEVTDSDIIRLRQEGMPLREIAAKVGADPATVSRRLTALRQGRMGAGVIHSVPK